MKKCPVCKEQYWPDDVCLRCALAAQNGPRADSLEDNELPEIDDSLPPGVLIGETNPYNIMIGGPNTGGPPENDDMPECPEPDVKPLPESVQEEIRTQENPDNELVGGMERGGSPENDGIPEARMSDTKPLPLELQEEIRRSIQETEHSGNQPDFGLSDRLKQAIAS